MSELLEIKNTTEARRGRRPVPPSSMASRKIKNYNYKEVKKWKMEKYTKES
jgi:hypothetical protein